MGLVSFPKRTNGITTLGAVETQSAMPKCSDIFPRQPLTGQHSWQHQIKDGGFVIESTGGDAKNGDRINAGDHKHGSGKNRRAIDEFRRARSTALSDAEACRGDSGDGGQAPERGPGTGGILVGTG